MIVVDSSVWIDHLNGRAGLETDLLRTVLDDATTRVVVGDLVLFEVLAGLRSPQMVADVRQLLESLEIVSMVGPELATRAAEHFRLLRSLGITSRTVDLLIATYCIGSGAALLTRDRDFNRLSDPIGLRLVAAGPS